MQNINLAPADHNSAYLLYSLAEASEIKVNILLI